MTALNLDFRKDARPWLLAALTGVLLGTAQPKFDWSMLAWVAWVPLLLAVRGQSPKRVFLLAWAAHAVALGITLYWIEVVVRVFGGITPLISWIPLALLVAYTALWMAGAFWWARRVELRYPRLSMYWTVPVFLVAAEWIRGELFTGFPWGHPGYALAGSPTILQIADLASVHGLLFVLAFASTGIAALIERLRTGRGGGPALVAVALAAAAFAYGAWRLEDVRQAIAEAPRATRVGLAQGNIEQHLKWSAEMRKQTVSIYEDLTKAAVADGAEIVFWPETAAPFYFRPMGDGESARIRELARETGAYVLIGAPAAEYRGERLRYLNRAYLIDGEGNTVGRYDKAHLVPFSEYVPLPQVFGWIEKLVPVVGSFAPGKGPDVLAAAGTRFGVLICFESVFPEEARLFVKDGAEFLTVITNDAWFLRTSATWQHIGMAVVRAVENRVPVLQAGNTGVTAVIGADGTMQEPLPIFERGYRVAELPLVRQASLYTAYGDVFAYVTLLLTALTFVPVLRMRRGETASRTTTEIHRG